MALDLYLTVGGHVGLGLVSFGSQVHIWILGALEPVLFPHWLLAVSFQYCRSKLCAKVTNPSFLLPEHSYRGRLWHVVLLLHFSFAHADSLVFLTF